MIKRLRVTVDGNAYEVTVEVPEDASGVPLSGSMPAPAAVPVSISTAAAPVVPAAPVTPAEAPTSAKSAGPAGAGDVPSPLSGRVTAVMVAAGQAVKEGDHLVTLEAMKMNTFVFATKTGKVSALLTEVGAVVEEGQVLVKID
jgi:biotin carboxyl carrier protein